MLLRVPWAWVEESTDGTPSWDEDGHGLTEGVGEDSQEHDGDVNDLWLEVEDFLQDGTEGRKTKPCVLLVVDPCTCARGFLLLKLTNEEHAEGPRVDGWVIVDVDNGGDNVLCCVKGTDLTLTDGCLCIMIVIRRRELLNTGFFFLADALLRAMKFTTRLVSAGGVGLLLILVDHGIRVMSGEAWPLHLG